MIKSFITVAPTSDFSLQNLPYGVFIPVNSSTPRIGVAIGDLVLDLSVISQEGLLGDGSKEQRYFADSTLNRFMSQGRSVWSDVRKRLTTLLGADCPTLRDNKDLRAKAFSPIDQVKMVMPVEVKGYTDFYSSIHHATNVGTLMRGAANALPPNWKSLPIAYDGRAGSVVVSGTDIHRPKGQSRPSDDTPPVFGPSKALDFELELAFVVGTGTSLGESVSCKKAEDHIFGVVILNDWSARDIQKWEYQPLGPFLGKNFGTSISPWVVTLEALEPYKVKCPAQDPEPLDYLCPAGDLYNIELQVALKTARMPLNEEVIISRTNASTLYWTANQQLAHHTINGCSISTGDLFATGTISGPNPDSLGCLLELTKGGKEPIKLNNGEERRYLQDGDTVVMRGAAQGASGRVGFGEVRGTVLPAR